MAQVVVRTATRDERIDSNNNSTSSTGSNTLARAAAPRSSSAFDTAQSMHVTHSARNEYPLNVSVDFTQLRTHALRRYMAFHRIPEAPGSSREQLAVAVARHFNEDCQRADERAAIASFVSYLKSSKEETQALSLDDADPTITHSRPYDYNAMSSASDSDNEPERERDSAYDYYPNDDGEDDDNDNDDEDDDAEFQVAPRKRKSSSSSPKTSKASKSDSKSALKKKRKARVYCVCKGASFGNMIACDSKTCADRSNWYHMSCVGLDPSTDPPETWFCPTCDAQDAPLDVPENQYRKPVASVTYGDMISHALTVLPNRKGSFKEICDFVETQYESQLNWKLESDQRKSPVWKSSVRKILFSNMRFRKHPSDKGVFCLAA